MLAVQFETEIELELSGENLGIQLHEVRGGKGAFVLGFYNTEQTRCGAESAGVAVGDIVAYIGGRFVSHNSLETIQIMLRSAKRPINIKFYRYCLEFNDNLFIQDYRTRIWLEKYLSNRFNSSTICNIQSKVDMLINSKLILESFAASSLPVPVCALDLKSVILKCIVFCLENYAIDKIPQSINKCVVLLLSSGSISNDELVDSLRSAHALLRDDLEATLFRGFQESEERSQVVGWLSGSPRYFAYTISNVLRIDTLSACYFLFLCQVGRQRKLHAYMLEGGDLSRQGVEVEAIKEGLLMAFYASQIYDLLLGEVDWGSADETAPTPRPGCVQRIARMGDKTLLPACWSLMFDALSPTDAACTSSMLLEQVGDCIRIDDSNVTGSACNGEIAGNQMALSLVVPSSTKAWRAGTYQPPRLYSFAMPMQGGAVTYGASLVFLRKYVPPAPDTLKSEVQVHAETQQYSIMKSEQNTNVLVATSSTTADNDGVPVLEQQEECSDSSASVPRWFSSTTGILGENQVTRLKVDAGAMLQSLRQWSEEQTAQLSKHGAFLAGDGAGQERPILSHMTSGGRKLLSPLLRAMGVGAGEDSTPSNYSEESAEVAMYGSYSALDYLNMQPQTSTASDSALLPYGLALFSNVPCVETLRTALKTAARECSREWGEEELQAWVRDSLAPVWAKFPKTAPPEAAAEVAWDFSPTAIYELLRPSDLATILAAAVLEYRILIITKASHSVMLLLGEWIRQAIHPLRWCHIYSPVAPQDLALELMECPAPYILGIARDSLEMSHTQLPRGVLVVDLDTGEIRIPTALAKALGATQSLEAKLSSVLRPCYTQCDSAVAEHSDGGKSLLEDGGVVMQGRSFVAQLLQPLPRCLVVLEREPELLVALDEGLYMRRVLRSISTDKSNAATRHSCERFIRQLLRTQCFSQYLLEFV